MPFDAKDGLGVSTQSTKGGGHRTDQGHMETADIRARLLDVLVYQSLDPLLSPAAPLRATTLHTSNI
ncbi:hypothetical protein J7394_22075 [Ruegeria sp. R13_0]|uniref:hypothetical protein n=1 Tax=Ruegeria sp. R13_0 TaxID=2821099 RepID=UPI001ADB2BAF|nr:hypothetical protein [Ruegeria sp. R13_0]MBO9436900.1 hypothetical protein [Ruegeria sp. R13_0]